MTQKSVKIELPKAKRRLRSFLPPNDLPMIIITAALVLFGLVMLMSSSQAYALFWHGDSLHFFKDQAVFALIGFAAMFFISRVDYTVLKKFAWLLYVVSFALLVCTLFMPPRNNARRWIFLAGFQFQPSEIAKFAVILLFSYLISKYYDKMRKIGFGYIMFLALLAPIAAVMLKQPHLSGTILIVVIGIFLMFVGGTRIPCFLVTAGVGIPAAFLFLKLSGKFAYAMRRIEIWFDPYVDARGSGYQTIQSLIAIGSGGFFGLGLGNSVQKHHYVPEPQNDFIFSIIAEELGFVGAVFVLGMFLYFVIRGFSIAFKARDRFGALLALGITGQVGLQAMLNIAVVTNSVPNTGISLPFFSQGGTSLVILLAEVGVLLSVSRYSRLEKS